MPSCIIVDGAVARTLTDHQHSTSVVGPGASYTFSMAWGTEAADRRLLVVADANTAGSISGVTIGGNAATLLASLSNTAIGMWILLVPTGTTGNIVVTVSATSTRGAVQLYSLTGMSASTASATATSTAAAPTSGAMTIPIGGVMVGGAFQAGGTAITGTWTGINGDATDSDALTCYSSGSLEQPSGGSVTATFTFTGTTGGPRGVFATFGP